MNQILDEDLVALGNKYTSMAEEGKSYEEIKEIVKNDGWKEKDYQNIMREVDDVILNMATSKSNKDALRVLDFAYYLIIVLGFFLFFLVGISFFSVIFIGGGMVSFMSFVNYLKSNYK